MEIAEHLIRIAIVVVIISRNRCRGRVIHYDFKQGSRVHGLDKDDIGRGE